MMRGSSTNVAIKDMQNGKSKEIIKVAKSNF